MECRVDKGSDCNIIVAYITKLFTINNFLSCTAPAINGDHLRLYWPQRITDSGYNKCFPTYKHVYVYLDLEIHEMTIARDTKNLSRESTPAIKRNCRR